MLRSGSLGTASETRPQVSKQGRAGAGAESISRLAQLTNCWLVSARFEPRTKGKDFTVALPFDLAGSPLIL